MPENSVFYERIVPILLIGLAIITILVILIALGALVRTVLLA
jgi:hypothetical protein